MRVGVRRGLEVVQERGQQQVTAGQAGYSPRDASLGSFPTPLVPLVSEILIVSVIQAGFSHIRSFKLFERNEGARFTSLGFFFFKCSSEIFFLILTSLLFLNFII